MNVALIGYGRMGRMVEDCIKETGGIAVCGIVDTGYLPSLSAVSGADVAIDFSYPGDLKDVLKSAVSGSVALVIGRTGLSDTEMDAIREAAAHIPIVWANNFSTGVTVLRRMVREMAAVLGDWDIEIVEAHHRGKLDAPSGTALMLRDAIDPAHAREMLHGREGLADARGREIGMHALRGGTVAGEHIVRFFGDGEELSIAHRADSRKVFATGALRAARFVRGKPAGLYDMDDVLFGRA